MTSEFGESVVYVCQRFANLFYHQCSEPVQSLWRRSFRDSSELGGRPIIYEPSRPAQGRTARPEAKYKSR